MINVNFFGTVNMTKAFLFHLMGRPEAHIVNVSSMVGFLPVPGQALYGTSKAAVKLFTEALFAEMMDTNVHVTIVFPGTIQTNIAANSGAMLTSASDAKMMDFLVRLMPKRAVGIIADQMKSLLK